MLFRLGIIMLVGSQVPYLGIIALPLIGLDWTAVGVGAVALVVTGEALFWVGVLLIGRDTWRTARRHGLRKTPRALWNLFRYGREAELEAS